MKVLSLFDGMACGALALQAAGIEIESYDAFEIDKYAIQTAAHNFPFIRQHGDVFKADFTQFKGVDLVCGGSPCTYWSIAQKNNRETEASGMGWELFQQYARAIKEAEPKYFIYENNKSMSKAIRDSIDKAFGFEAVLINSALVSAQNRQRLYWVGKRNADGTYSKVNVEQPIDRGILLKDILEGGDLTSNDKSYALTASYNGAVAWNTIERSQRNMVVEPVLNPPCDPRGREKSRTITAGYQTCSQRDLRMDIETDGFMGKQGVAEPVNVTAGGKSHCIKAGYYKQGMANFVTNGGHIATAVAEPIRVGCLPSPSGELRNSQAFRVYSTEGKSVNLLGQGGGAGAKTGLYAIPVEFDGAIPIKAVSAADGKTYAVYEVKDGKITIKGKQYPIKLVDGYYIIRKLTVRECMRLQTVPEWYEFPVSDSQAYKMLGNGWTVDVIAHLLKSIKECEI